MVNKALRVLVLGGSAEASALARRLAAAPHVEATLSLAGATRRPGPQPVPVRTGGFGGVAGLRDYLVRERIDRVVDATHPFAARMSANAQAACAGAGVPRLVLTRPAWTAGVGDRWIAAADGAAAFAALGGARCVFLALGRQSLGPFLQDAGRRYVVRCVDPPDAAPPSSVVILDRGPFDMEAEQALFLRERIDAIVAKNSGGPTTAKLHAARRLRLPVVLIARPPAPAGPTTDDIDEAFAFATGASRAP